MAARVINFATGRDLERPAPEQKPDPPLAIDAVLFRNTAFAVNGSDKQARPADGCRKPAPAGRKRGTEAAEQRKVLLAKIHVAKKQLGLTEEEYRALLDGHFGAASAADLGLTDLKRLVLVLVGYGFKPSKGHARRGVSRKRETPATLTNDNDNLGREPLMKKIEAQLTEKGRAEGTDVPWGYAVAILKRQSGGVTRCFEHATPEQLRGVIAALTRDARRNGRRAY
ncbi:hypothetical protein HMPREF1022_02273 [Desulfovibrio sp. 6_1_46AFAA]|uniref:regulatory protein GemA n=1 Tax=Desulfovibrio sp. 6_1_46AFAA TaxID=665942 RepID=UPI0002236CA4|nr:regulatory protein GemA [Desulfovibrio sp. 6_1_46AFAA]EGW50712.1 hypothetical protein HMPREF1022_02273 [Desulfovibrio sp. 6_1_46AFAA]